MIIDHCFVSLIGAELRECNRYQNLGAQLDRTLHPVTVFFLSQHWFDIVECISSKQ